MAYNFIGPDAMEILRNEFALLKESEKEINEASEKISQARKLIAEAKALKTQAENDAEGYIAHIEGLKVEYTGFSADITNIKDMKVNLQPVLFSLLFFVFYFLVQT